MLEKEFNIMLIDDHQLIIDGIKSMFTEEKRIHFAFEANDGLTAREIIAENHDKINLIIADVNMPGLTGIELCQFVKQNFNDIKVLILSMYQRTSVVKEAVFAEADGYIIKNTGKVDFSKALFRKKVLSTPLIVATVCWSAYFIKALSSIVLVRYLGE